MSNIDKMTANEQLFTELTPEEGAMTSGGVKVYLSHFDVKSTQEWPRDEIRLYADGKKVYSEGGFFRGGVGVGIHNIDKTYEMSGSSDVLTLIEKDWLSQNENLGSATISTSDGYGLNSVKFNRKGANYMLYYAILPF